MLAASRAQSADAVLPNEFRIGWQKSAGVLAMLKANRFIEEKLRGVRVIWTEYPTGLAILKAIGREEIDLGYCGESPAIHAQAAGVDFVYLAYEAASPRAEGILVQYGSTIQRVADLRGKKVAFSKGSDAHWMLYRLLQNAGMQLSDIQQVDLPPTEARAAFQHGVIDAWAIWDPYQAAAQTQINARQVVSGEGAVNHHEFFIARRLFAKNNPDVIATVMDEVNRQSQLIRTDFDRAAQILTPILGLSRAALGISLERYRHIVKPIDDDVLQAQQVIADTFFKLGLVPRKIDVRQNMLKKRP